MSRDPTKDPKSVKLHCAICFDLGFTDTCYYGQLDDNPRKPPAPAEGRLEERLDKLSLEDPSSLEDTSSNHDTSNASVSPPHDDSQVSNKEPAPSTLAEWLDDRERHSGEGHPLVLAEPLRNRINGELTETRTLLTSFSALGPEVSRILRNGGGVPETLENYYSTIRAKILKNRMTPLEYWLKQYCPARMEMKGEGDSADALPPCVQIRRGVHEFLIEREESYRDAQGTLMHLGFVQSTDSPVRLTVAHPAVKTISKDDIEGKNEGAFSWSVEVFLLDRA